MAGVDVIAKKGDKSAKDKLTTADMVLVAVETLNEKKGSSLAAVKKFVSTNFDADPEKIAPLVNKAIKSLVAKEALVQTSGTGASGSFKLAKKAKSSAADTATKAVGDKKKAKRKPAEESTAAKPVAKKAGSKKAKNADEAAPKGEANGSADEEMVADGGKAKASQKTKKASTKTKKAEDGEESVAIPTTNPDENGGVSPTKKAKVSKKAAEKPKAVSNGKAAKKKAAAKEVQALSSADEEMAEAAPDAKAEANEKDHMETTSKKSRSKKSAPKKQEDSGKKPVESAGEDAEALSKKSLAKKSRPKKKDTPKVAEEPTGSAVEAALINGEKKSKSRPKKKPDETPVESADEAAKAATKKVPAKKSKKAAQMKPDESGPAPDESADEAREPLAGGKNPGKKSKKAVVKKRAPTPAVETADENGIGSLKTPEDLEDDPAVSADEASVAIESKRPGTKSRSKKADAAKKPDEQAGSTNEGPVEAATSESPDEVVSSAENPGALGEESADACDEKPAEEQAEAVEEEKVGVSREETPGKLSEEAAESGPEAGFDAPAEPKKKSNRSKNAKKSSKK